MFRYKTVEQEGCAEQVINRSRFIAHVRPVESKGEADAFFGEIRAKHRNATHNVPAYVIGEKFECQWASDDGEPQGTSGAPMVQMLVKEGITNVAVIITRYFGGIKLGTGGLVRAYTGSAKLGLEAAGLCRVQEMQMLTVSMEYTYLGKLQNMEQNKPFTIEHVQYSDVVTVTAALEPEYEEEMRGLLSNLTGASFRELDSELQLVKRKSEF